MADSLRKSEYSGIYNNPNYRGLISPKGGSVAFIVHNSIKPYVLAKLRMFNIGEVEYLFISFSHSKTRTLLCSAYSPPRGLSYDFFSRS